MDHDTNLAPDATTPGAPPPAGDPEPVADPAALAACTSVFDRWCCGEPEGHDGPHRAVAGGSTASWNDSATGRGLRGWTTRTMRGPRAGATHDE